MLESLLIIIELTEIRQTNKHKKGVYVGHSIFVNIIIFIMALFEIDLYLPSLSLSLHFIPKCILDK